MYKPLFNQRKALRFRQFTRKGYALFACLGRVVTIGVLSVATLQSASAASDDFSSTAEASDDSHQKVDKEATLTACTWASRENGHCTEPRGRSGGASTKY